tara:strand:- start:429 stop:989 length:561 start_codon:yes stop_codon:yes gene_type:complete
VNPISKKKNLEEVVENLRELSYLYLEKYSPTKQQLRTYLFKKIIIKKKLINEKKDVLHLIDLVIANLEKNSLINDKFYSDSQSKNYLKKGYSINKIRHTLFKKGINNNYIEESISKIKEVEFDPDFFSAIKLCHRRKIGPNRNESNRKLFYKKDMGILARSGFNFETSKSVLNMSRTDFEKLLKFR